MQNDEAKPPRRLRYTGKNPKSFNEKYKESVLNEHKSKFNLPFYITWFLMFLKVLHYNLGILPIYYYSLIKKIITNKFYDDNKSEFVVVDIGK